MIQNICIVGLGLIGGSFAKAIKAKTNHFVLGYDRGEDVVLSAQAEGAIDGALTPENLHSCDLVLIALFPDDVIEYCKSNFEFMRKGAIVCDCAGVKTRICMELSGAAYQHGVRFVGGHPMAGAECWGFGGSFAGLFDGATMILCEDGNPDRSALEELQAFFTSLGFGYIKNTTARDHDEIIAYTSQLAHLVSSAYIRSDTMERRYGFSAGSFKDLTRVAKLNEPMWSALFFENRENLLRETDAFIIQVQKYREALAASDHETIKELLQSSAERKARDEEEERCYLEK
jgi:prephenate dehydrogenase